MAIIQPAGNKVISRVIVSLVTIVRKVTINKMADVTSKRALVVDDEAIIGDFYSRILSVEGFEVDIASNGSIASSMLQQKDYDLCLLDIRIPVMDGRELYQVIVSKYPRLVSKVIFASGDVLDTYTQRFLQLTGRPYLAKPFTPDELKSMVKKVLGND